MGKPAAFEITPRTTFHRLPARGSYDREVAYAILDEGLVCSVGVVIEGQPYVIPMVYARLDDELVLHGAMASRLLKNASKVPVCVTVTLVDGLVFARSGFHHSMNYRSVMVLGQAQEITHPDAKRRALDAIVDHPLPGRAKEARAPNEKELAATRVLLLPIEEASVKTRSGGPNDDEEDLEVPVWAGHLPLRVVAGTPVTDARFAPKADLPAAIAAYQRGRKDG